MDNEVVSIQSILFDFFYEKFPHHNIQYVIYHGAAPGDYNGPHFRINDKIIGHLIFNFTEFTPFSAPNARKKYRTIKIHQPDFLDLIHKMAIYELGYDPLRPGSREAFMGTIKEWEEFHPDVMKIYYSLQ